VTLEPYFEKASIAGEARPRLLLLTHHFPPGSAVGALRWTKLAVHLSEAGWDLDVISARLPSDVPLSGEIAAELPVGIRIWQVAGPEAVTRFPERLGAAVMARFSRLRRRTSQARGHGSPSQRQVGIARSDLSWDLLSRRSYVRLYLTCRDYIESRAWALRVHRLGRGVLRLERGATGGRAHAAIITSGPPHAWHEAGRRLSRRTGIPFVMDLRDPWSTVNVVHEYFATPAWPRLAHRLESRAVDQAALIVANTDMLRETMAAAFPGAAKRMITVMNGYDEEPLPPSDLSRSRFRIGYAGSIYFGRDPRPLFRGVARVITELDLARDQIAVYLKGDVQEYGGVATAEIARDCGIAEYVHLGGRVDHREALEFMASCHMLVSLPWNDTISIPAKVFEYMRFRAWLLVFAYPDSALERMLRGTDADVLHPDDVDSLAAAVRRRYLDFRKGALPAPVAGDPRLSRRAQALRLVEALRECTGTVDRRPK
jgi:glycosyltransferase involved in cell wall biosynthesis